MSKLILFASLTRSERLYSKTFTRYIKQDKVRGTVTSWKLGVMGRNTITINVEAAPNFLQYKSDDDLLRLVDEESKKIGTTQNGVPEKVKSYFHQSDDWLHEDYWK